MNALVELVELSCGSCGTAFAIAEQLYKQRRKDHGSFYCPNGHNRYFPGESEEEKLRRQLKAQQDYAESLNSRLDQRERSLSATRGVVTKLRKRAVAGACPFGCHRTFANVARHVATVHPDGALDVEVPG
jgi:hypothetical protein